MAIVSFNFFVFCAAVLILYYIFPSKKYQWTVLLAASYAYYIICCNKYTFYLIATTAMAWVGGLIMDRLTVNCAAAGVKDNRATSVLPDCGPVIYISGRVSFGGVEII